MRSVSAKLTPAMQDKRLAEEGKVVPIGAQGNFHGVGFWEVFQTTNGTLLEPSVLTHWNLWHSDPSGIERLPHRTIAVELMLQNRDITGLAQGELGFYMVESYWDNAGTILADRYYKSRTAGVNGNVESHFRLFAPVTGISKIGEGEGSSGNEVPQITLRITRNPYDVNAWQFSDFEMQRIYLPPENYNYLDKT